MIAKCCTSLNVLADKIVPMWTGFNGNFVCRGLLTATPSYKKSEHDSRKGEVTAF